MGRQPGEVEDDQGLEPGELEDRGGGRLGGGRADTPGRRRRHRHTQQVVPRHERSLRVLGHAESG